MTCKSCGNEIKEESRFCAECGADQGTSGSLPPIQPDPRIGVVLEDKYRLDSKIGVGGMATVYRATRVLIGDSVAVKILHADQLRDPQAPERFRREAQAAARLKHPNAVTIYDFGVSESGIVYLVMELVEGQSLRRMVKERGPLFPSAASEIMTQVCAALDEAHRQNIVHRDVKPDNIIVADSQNGIRVKVLDFGIARLRDMSTLGNLTQTGSVMGTPHYMSPEQCLGEELDGRSDIYSLGIVLYEMLAGVVPFNSPTSMAVVVQHVSSAPAPLRVLNVSISPQVEAVTMRALEKRREARPQTAGALATELAAAVAGSTFTGMTQSAPEPTKGQVTPEFLPTVQMATPWSTGAAVPTPRAAGPTRTTLAGSAAAASGKQNALIGAGVLVVAIAGLVWHFMGRPAGAAEPPSAPAPTAAALPASTQASTGPATTTAPADSGGVQPAGPVERSTTPAAGTATAPRSAERAAANTSTGTGDLTLHSQPDSAVDLDGRTIGNTDAKGFLLLAKVPGGRHLLIVKRDGFRTDQRTIAVEAGRADVIDIKLEAAPGSITLSANVTGAAFQIDGIAVPADKLVQREVAPGRHKVTASKAGFKSATADVDVRVGEDLRTSLTLSPVSPDDLLGEAESSYRLGEYEKAILSARAVLANEPQSAKANLVMGNASYRLKRLPESTIYYLKAIDLGETIEFPAKHRHGGLGLRVSYCDGVLAVSRKAVTFRSQSEPDHAFSVVPSKITELSMGNLQLHTKLLVMNKGKNKEDDKNFDFVHPGVVRVASDQAGLLTELRCAADCDGSLSVLMSVLQRARR